LRIARSPDPPKITMVEGSGMRWRRRPSRNGFWTVVVASAYSFSISALRAADALRADRLAPRG